MDIDIAHLSGWIGRRERAEDTAALVPLKALTAALDRNDPPGAGEPIPPLWHWLYFLPVPRHSEIGEDGHPRRGGFLPPVPLPRRMWAGSRLEFRAPLRAGQAISRESRIEDVKLKEGRAGLLVFVKVRHEISAEGQLAIAEEQDIVYREMPQPGAAAPAGTAAPDDAAWTRRIEPDPVLLFRYSALTLNGHRIHYDRTYATEAEGYPGLVVHGPLIATLLLDLLRRELPGREVAAFSFKAVSPIFDIASFEVCGRLQDEQHARLWARTAAGHLAMEASATLA